MQILLRLKSLAPFPGDPLYFRIPGSQLLQFLVGGLAGRTFFQKVGKVLVDVHSICPCHFYHCVNQSTSLRSGWNDREQPVFPTNNHLLYGSLTGIVRKTAASIQKIVLQKIPSVADISYCFVKTSSLLRILFLKPRLKALQNRLFLLKASFFDLVRCQMTRTNVTLYHKKLVDIGGSLNCRNGIIVFLSSGNGFHKVASTQQAVLVTSGTTL